QLKGYAHFLPLGKRPQVFLFGSRLTKLPSWFQKHDWGASIEYLMTNLFPEKLESGLTTHDLGSYSISVSAPERAIMELLHIVPQRQSFEEARLLMEGLTTLRSQLVQELLELCRSVKVKRLFLFLAEECHHSWMKQLKTTKINLGKGKRFIIQNGRLDPIYNITVPKGAFSDERRLIQAFLNNRGHSPATKLMVAENARKISFEPSQGVYASIAFLAYADGKLNRLDELIRNFDIESQGTSEFKGKLNENWLDKVDDGQAKKIRNVSNDTIAALTELVVADELKRRGFKIVRLSARDLKNPNPDIVCCKSGQDLNVEVKYIGEPPKTFELIDAQLRGKQTHGYWSDEEASFNYFFAVIAKSAKQLQKFKDDSRQVWLVFESGMHTKKLRESFEGRIKPGNWPDKWYEETDEQKDVLNMFEKEIITRSPSEWLKKISTLVLATMKDWYLEDIVKYKTKDLVK
ncbi:MAG: type IV toxin-antitoxin system AbiEi family antitoxin domain-containing protein, partial [bacterium]